MEDATSATRLQVDQIGADVAALRTEVEAGQGALRDSFAAGMAEMRRALVADMAVLLQPAAFLSNQQPKSSLIQPQILYGNKTQGAAGPGHVPAVHMYHGPIVVDDDDAVSVSS